ncbi:MAG: aminotransferase class V-fold PLP-dependent enzyme [Clostridia bacterium]|nr:aminotransferase class V-fold PLP-dependent enzyme [Clostridia bacterium]
MIYLDNAATTHPKPERVYFAVSEAIREGLGNPSRSTHALARSAEEKIYEAREAVCRLLSVDSPEGVVFSYNATYALNIAIKSVIDSPCEVITSDIEHNAVVRPLAELGKRYGVKVVKFDSGSLTEEGLEGLITKDTRAIVSTLHSNVFGRSVDESILSRVAKKHGLYLILDGSQALGHRKIDLKKSPCYAICAPSHKSLFGIQGSGFVYFSCQKRGKTVIEGGSGTESRNKTMPSFLPDGYEAGTPGVPSIISLLEGLSFIESVGIDAISARIDFLTEKLYDRLSSVKGTTVYPFGGGILSFNLSGVPSHALSEELDRLGICSRAGLHCAPSAHSVLGTLEGGAVRLSLSALNTEKELDRAYMAIKEISKSLAL